MLIAAAPLIGLFKQKNRGTAAKAHLVELINDELGLIAALIGTLFIIWGRPIADPIAAIFVATIIAINSIRLIAENLRMLVGGRLVQPSWPGSRTWPAPFRACRGFTSYEPRTSVQRLSQRESISRCRGASPLRRQIASPIRCVSPYKKPWGAGTARSTRIP